jgi:hypothetical protein
MRHTEILRALQQFEGYPAIRNWHLVKIRKAEGIIYRQPQKLSETAPKYLQALAIIQADLESSLMAQWVGDQFKRIFE